VSGHSHWAGIKHKKALVDAKKGKVFSRIAKEIILAAQRGGGDTDSNVALRAAIEAAKAVNMPRENIERAVKRGTGELPGMSYESLTYEGYGPNGIAILVDVVTDSRNRTAAELRKIFALRSGKLEGSVAWMFEAKGLITIPLDAIGEDDLMALVIEAGADDMTRQDRVYEVTTSPQDFHAVKKAITDKGVTPEMAELTRLPKDLIKLEGDASRKALALLEELDDHDDVKNVFTNFDVPAELAEAKT
jgi:YebC/PmpR family DNA-binding regulatory protein